MPVLLFDTAAAAQHKCSVGEHRQFNFWVGKWEVTAQGGIAGHNEIPLEKDGGVLHDTGGLADGALVLTGTTTGPGGKPTHCGSSPGQSGSNRAVKWRRNGACSTKR